MPPADLRTRILEAAFALLAEVGVTELTQPKVSRAAGITQSHLTYYFPTRADLLLAVAQHALLQTAARLHEEIVRAPDGRVERGAATFQSAITDKRMVRVMLGLIVASDEDRKIKAALRDFITRVRAVLRTVLEELGAPADEAAVAALHATAIGAAVMNLARDNEESRREVGTIMRYALARAATAKGATRATRTHSV